MANIRKNTSGSYTAYIRKKNINLTDSFKNKEDAELWVDYKEDLIDLISSFDPPLQEMITLQDAIEVKIKDVIEKGKKDIYDFKVLIECFSKFCPCSLSEITYEILLSYFDEMMKTPIRRGGCKDDKTTGNLKLPSIHTTFRKFGYLSTVFQMMKEKGVNVDNHALKVCQFMRSKLTKKEKNEKINTITT